MENKISLNFTIFLSTFLLLCGCKESNHHKRSYFGGKIINPKSNNVILYKNDIALDTFYLNSNDTFLSEIPYITEDLYHFKHGNEHQYVYLEPQDSLLIRLSTWDFDESLVFSGNGAERNNLLIDCFLESEKDNKLFYSFYDLNPSNFRKKVDSTEKVKLDRYDDYIANHPKASNKFKNILKIALTYPLYSKVENYPMAHSVKVNDDVYDKIGDDFYKHRDQVTLNQDSIMNFYAYRDFIVSNLYNKAYLSGYQISTNEFTSNLLETIAMEIKNENTRNLMLRKTAISYFFRKSSDQINDEYFKTYLKLSTSLKDKQLVNQLLKDINTIQTGSVLNDFKITDYNETKRSIQSIIKNKTTALFFWNPDYMSKEYFGKRVDFLLKKHPSLKFICIKINGDDKDRMKELDFNSQFYLENDSNANLFLTSKLPRTILINKKGIVVNGFASISSNKILNQLENLTKK